jgi:diphosphomevalonate decarboxylase
MGKTNNQGNLPTNASLSWTLLELRTRVEIELVDEGLDTDLWEPLPSADGNEIRLSARGRERFLGHFNFLKEEIFKYNGHFIVRSVNNFPADCGLASSASSFAALTKGAAIALSELSNRGVPSEAELSDWSRQGSGSSCRSFFAPWALWEGAQARAIHLPVQDLVHVAVITEDSAKVVSSSEAHRRVTGSDLFFGRVERAESRLKNLLGAVTNNDWKKAHNIVWSEFWDMHALFETAEEPFGYMNAESMEVLQYIRKLWTETGDGPWVTMDAGPNVHLLFRKDQERLLDSLVKDWSGSRKMIVQGRKRGAWDHN